MTHLCYVGWVVFVLDVGVGRLGIVRINIIGGYKLVRRWLRGLNVILRRLGAEVSVLLSEKVLICIDSVLHVEIIFVEELRRIC